MANPGSLSFKPSERPELYKWEYHTISYSVPVLQPKRDDSKLDRLIVDFIKQFYEGGNKLADTVKDSFFWLVGAVEEPTIEAKETGAVSRVVLLPTWVLAGNRDNAIAFASKAIEGEWEQTRTRFIVKWLQDDNGKF